MKKLNKVEAEVLEFLQANAGKRFETHQVAAHFGVGTQSIRKTLHSLEGDKERIWSETPRGNGVQWYVKLAEVKRDGVIVEPREVFKRGQELRPDPIFLGRVEDARAHRAAYPSRFN